MQRRRGRIAGFTLVELMIVVGIVGILATLAIPAFNAYIRKSRRAEGLNMLDRVYKAASSYFHRDHIVDNSVTSTVYTGCIVTNDPAVVPAYPRVPNEKKYGDFGTLPSWAALGITEGGSFYYSYYLGSTASTDPGNTCLPGSVNSFYDFVAFAPYRETTPGKAMADVLWYDVAISRDGLIRGPGIQSMDMEGSLTVFGE